MNLDSPEGQGRAGQVIQGGSREKSSGTFGWKELPRGSTVVSRTVGIQTARLSASDRSGSRFGQENLGRRIGERQDFNVRELPFKSNTLSSTYQETIFEGNNSEEGQQCRRGSQDS